MTKDEMIAIGNGPGQKAMEQQTTGLVQLSARYSDNYMFRALIQGIPYVGSPLDSLFAGEGARWKAERLEAFLKLCSQRLDKIELDATSMFFEPSEELYDFWVTLLDGAISVHSYEKRAALVLVATRQVIDPQEWEEAAEAAQIVRELSEFDIVLLREIANAPICVEPFNGLQVVSTLHEPFGSALSLPVKFPTAPKHAIQLSCSKLYSRGILADEGVGRLSTKAATYFVLTDLGQWFLSWLGDQDMPG